MYFTARAIKIPITIDQNGIIPASYQFLDNIIRILKENPDVRLEAVLHAIENETQGSKMLISENLARELAFYFKNQNIGKDAFRSQGFSLSHQIFKPFVPGSKTIDGEIEFIFMKN